VLAAALLVPVAAATVAATNDWWFFASHAPQPLTTPVVVKSGSWDGKRWDLLAYRAASQGICFTITPSAAATSGLGAAMNCGGFSTAPPESPGGPRGITYLSASSSEPPTYVPGPVIDTAAEVAIYFANGHVVRTPTFDAPTSLGAVRFYAAPVGDAVIYSTGPGRRESLVQKLVGLDSEGGVVACAALDPASRC
jgi:hypothetical protein